MSQSPWRPVEFVQGSLLPHGADPDMSLIDAFTESVRLHRARPAVADATITMTYAELDEASRYLATLVPAGPPELPVAVLSDHGVSGVVAMLAVARAGRCWLALDPRAPGSHQREILQRHGIGVVLADRANASRAGELVGQSAVVRIEDSTRADREPGAEPSLDPRAPVMVSSTSGTSGTPKSVVHSHRNIVSNARRFAAAIQASPDDRLFATLPFAFVASATPLFTALLTGGTAVIHDLLADPHTGFVAAAREAQASVAFLTAGLITAIAEGDEDRASRLRVAVTGGDRLTVEQVRRVYRAFPQAQLLHRYNTSETNWVTGLTIEPHALPAAGSVPIGWPVPWLDVELLDESGYVVDGPGEGEIVVRGDRLALGYLDDPELTAQRFFEGGDTYRTGDVAMRDGDGLLEFIGRVDDTVKVNDVLVDPARVEAALEVLPGVTAAAVLAREDERGRTRLAAYVVSPSWSATDLRAELVQALPVAAIPATITLLDSLPLTPMGKVDRAALAALQEPTNGGTAKEHPQPPTRTQEKVAGLMAAILEIPQVALDDDFLALGGDSLALAQLRAELTREFGVEVTASRLIEHATPAGIATLVDQPPRPRRRHDPHLVKHTTGPADGPLVLMFAGAGGTATAGMARLARRLPDATCYQSIPRATEYRGRTDRTVPALAASAVADWWAVVGRVERPVVCLGMSSGGTLAVEAARQLRSGGQEVGLVILLDAAARSPRLRAERKWRATAARAIAADTAKRRGEGLSTPWWLKAAWALRVIAVQVRSRVRARTVGLLAPRSRAKGQGFLALMDEALRPFRESPYEGNVLLVRAGGWPDGHPWRIVEDLRWGDYVRGDLRIVHADVTHPRMVDAAGVEVIGELVREGLAQLSR